VYEPRHHRPLPLARFVWRLLGHSAVAAALVAFSIAIGMWGYVVLEQLSWIDAFLNTAMLLGGMGPVNLPHTDAGKLFAAFYALYAGVVFLLTAGLVFTPVFHRLLHRFHWDEKS
jgi:hypothetical protein